MYYPDEARIALSDVKKRIEGTDLVPSRTSLLADIRDKFSILEKNGITTLADLRKQLKDSKHIHSFSNRTGIDLEYLALLRREIESYFPNPRLLREFEMKELLSFGLRDTRQLFEAMEVGKIPRSEPAWSLADLSRVQWVSPTFAKMLLATGYDSPASLSNADPEKLCEDLERINTGDKFFKGKIGLRDVRRLIDAARYAEEWS